jgi:hypothetical protein
MRAVLLKRLSASIHPFAALRKKLACDMEKHRGQAENQCEEKIFFRAVRKGEHLTLEI